MKKNKLMIGGLFLFLICISIFVFQFAFRTNVKGNKNSKKNLTSFVVSKQIQVANQKYNLQGKVSYLPKDIELKDFKADTYDISVGTEKEVSFTVKVISNTKILEDNIAVYDNKNNCIGYMNDNGMNGDKISGDGLYTLKTLLKSEQQENINYYSKIQNIESNKFEICFFNELKKSDFTSYFSFQDGIKDIEKEYVDENGYVKQGKKTILLEKIKKYMQQQKEKGNIKDFEVNEDGETIDVTLKSGIPYIYSIKIEGTDSEPTNKKVSTYQPFKSSSLYSKETQNLAACVDESAKKIANLADENYTFFGNYDDNGVSLNELKNLSDMKVIIWHGHGGYSSKYHSYLYTNYTLDEKRFLFDPIYYIEHINYSADYISGRIIVENGFIVVTSKFFDKYIDKLDNSLVYLGTCKSGKDDVLGNTFINKGASTVFVNTDTIHTKYNLSMIRDIFNEMTSKPYATAGEALEAAQIINGKIDFIKEEQIITETKIIGKPSFRLVDNTINDKGTQYKSVFVSNYCTYGLKQDNTLWAWGDNEYGQLGDGTTQDRYIPIKVMDNVVSVSTGSGSSYAVKKDRSLWAWGFNWHGQLGDGTTQDKYTPIKVMDNVVSVSSSTSSSYAIKEDRSLWAWGYNGDGELGDGTTQDKYTPIKVMDNVVSVSSSTSSSYAIKEDRSLWAWGDNWRGQLGDGTTQVRYSPIKVLDNVVSISIGLYSGYAVKEDGSLWTWGYNKYGELGDGTTQNRYSPIKVMDNVASISTGSGSSYAVKEDGSLWAWGYNGYGQLGDSTTQDRYIPIKIMDNVVSVARNLYSSYVVKEDGSLWAWGYNGYGQLGDGTTQVRYSPVKIINNVASIECGDWSNYVIKEDGSLWAWGDNQHGQLGDGTTQDRYSPIKISD